MDETQAFKVGYLLSAVDGARKEIDNLVDDIPVGGDTAIRDIVHRLIQVSSRLYGASLRVGRS